MSILQTDRIYWKDVLIGDHGFLSVSYIGNTDVRVIPRAKGVRIRTTEELGGGYLKIRVSGIVSKTNRIDLEEYFLTLDSVFELNASGTLKVYGDAKQLELTDCVLEDYSQEENDLKSNTFSMTFIKSL